MSTLLRVISAGTLCVLAAAARGQFAPPGDPGASPATQNSVQVLPPSVASRPDADPAPAANGSLAVVRAKQPLTANALIGFVDAEPIFANDLFRPIDADLRRLAATSKTLGEFERNARTLIANQILERKSEIVFAAAAEAQLTDRERAYIDMRLALERSTLIADHGGSVPAAERALAAAGSSLDKEMADARRRAVQGIYFDRNLRPRIVITREMLLEAYDRDLDTKWKQPAQVELFTITLALSNWLRETTSDGQRGPVMKNPTPEQIQAAETQALAQARKIVEQLQAGADFAALAEDNESIDGKRSVGGRWGMISRGSKENKKEEDFIFALTANSIGEPLLLRDEKDFRNSSVVVAKIGRKTEARTVPFSEAQSQIASDLRLAQLRTLQVQEMQKLERSAAIEGVDRMREVALEAAITRYVMP
jgi:hypothetical protein